MIRRAFWPALAFGALLTPQTRAATLDLKADCHATGDSRADDSAALKLCMTQLQQQTAAGRPASLHIPAGVFRLSGAAGLMPVLGRGASITGEGPHATTLLLDADFAGDVFAWDEAWTGGSWANDHINLAADATGPTLAGMRITGQRGAPHRQNAVVFYDRNDHVLLRDIEVDVLDGACLAIGQTRRMPEAYMRESTIINLKCFGSGAADAAAVTLGSTAELNSDATNELDIYKLAIFDSPGQGLAIRNAHAGSATRGIRAFGLRVEKTGAEGVSIGDPRDFGQVAGISIFNLTIIQSGAAALRIAANPAGPQPYAIRVSGGLIGPGNTRGVEIDNGRLIDIDVDGIDAPVVLGPHAGADITIGGNGAQGFWHFAGTRQAGEVASPLELRSPYTLRGFPGAGDRVGAAALKATLQGAAAGRLTMDGAPPSAYNCFNPAYGQGFSLDLHILLQDTDKPTRFYAWSVPEAVLSAWYGPGTARLTAMKPIVLQHDADGASVDVAADPAHGCLSVLAHTPPPAAEHWAASASITYVRAP